MLEIVVTALATLFTTIGPFDVAAAFVALTSSATPAERRSYAVRGTLIATVILGVFALTGDFILSSFGISMAPARPDVHESIQSTATGIADKPIGLLARFRLSKRDKTLPLKT